MKRFLSFFMAVIIGLSLGLAALADDPEPAEEPAETEAAEPAEEPEVMLPEPSPAEGLQDEAPAAEPEPVPDPEESAETELPETTEEEEPAEEAGASAELEDGEAPAELSWTPADVAEETEEIDLLPALEAAAPEETEDLSDVSLPDSDTLFAGYADSVMMPEPAASGRLRAARRTAGSRLEGYDQILYSALRAAAAEIAAGSRSSTVVEITLSELGLEGRTWSAAELGVDSITETTASGNLQISSAAIAALKAQLPFDQHRILQSLMSDCPYDLYWFDKTASTIVGRPSYGASYNYSLGEYVIFYKGAVSFKLPAASEYAGTSVYEVDTSVGLSVQSAAENARDIAASCSGMTDLEKLHAFRREICALVSYNHDAPNGGMPYGNPWQLIWVFDGDPDTNVVCEGYAKAFKYLCDLSDFESGIGCILVTGKMNGGTGEGDHMWNIVAMDDRQNYLVDVTNCDAGTIGADQLLFLTSCASGSAADGYVFNCGQRTIRYSYDSDTRSLFSDGELTISDTPYVRPTRLKITAQPADAAVEKVGDKVRVSVAAQGDGLTYQWYCKNAGASNWWVSSVKSTNYAVTMKEAYHGRQLYCVVTDKYGNSVPSDTATIFAKTLGPVIQTQPQDTVVSAVGEKVRVTVTAAGDGLTYQWYCKDKGSSKWWASSVKMANYVVTMSKAYHGRQLYCVITDQNGKSVQSATVTIGAKTLGPVILTQPKDAAVSAAGQKLTVKMTAAGDGLTYQWYCRDAGASNWWVSSVKSTNYAVTMQEAYHGRQLYCVITDQNGKSVQSVTVTIGAKSLGPVILTQPKDVTVSSAGQKLTVKMTAAGDGLTYQWYYKNAGTSTWWTSSVKSASYAVTMKEAYHGRQLYCVISDQNGKSVQSATVTIGAKSLGPVILTQPKDVTVSAAGQKLTVKMTAAGDGLTYQWYYKNAGTSTWWTSSVKSTNYAVTMKEAYNGRQLYCVVTDQNGKSVQSDTVTIRIG